jgi:hypothetical protein
MRKMPVILALLFVFAGLGGCGTFGSGNTVRQGNMKSTLMTLQPCTDPAGCAQGITYGRGLWGPQLKYVLHQQPTRQGVVSRVAVNGSSQGLINTIVPVALSAWGGWQAAALAAGRGGIQIYNKGGDAQALTQQTVDVEQNPNDPDANIDTVDLYPPAPPGN